MKYLNIVLPIVIIVVLAGLGFVAYSMYQDQLLAEQQAEATAKAEQEAITRQKAAEEAQAARTKCIDSDSYSIVTFDRDGSVGQDILVKSKGTNANKCEYLAADGDFELKNSDPQYYKAQIENSLVTDIGTGPSGRSFRLYDLKDKNMVVEKQYFNDLTIASGTLTYFGLSKTKADKKNCKDFEQFTKDGLTPTLVVKKTIDLKTYSAKETKETSCVSVQ